MEYLVRYSIPSRLEPAPFGTIWKAVGDNDNHELYIQVSKDDNPQWLKVRSLLEKAFDNFLANESFIEACLALYLTTDNKEAQYKIISDLLNTNH